ncbi:uncharacterized protein LOC127877868 [Dreissena polymorpha]|uniref:Uncharacterized protein n=1 Tax=Dreissena polymorpha TaxID=45954 RepID=A0A9D4QP80_DREPO|nr:uncharacterized protein LOC127877868 [Dreissena polymorpha]KAH3837345.1 hypothetical protein DPMN_110731 [Dreissena polymorpha]
MASLLGIAVLVALFSTGSLDSLDLDSDGHEATFSDLLNSMLQSDWRSQFPQFPRPPDTEWNHFPHNNGYQPSGNKGGSSAPGAHRVLCASMPWTKGVFILPGLVCEMNCCQRGEHVECCEEKDEKHSGFSKLSIVLLSVFGGLLFVAVVCAAFACYKYKMSQKRKTRPTPNTPISILSTNVSAISYGPNFNHLPRKTQRHVKYEVPEQEAVPEVEAPPTYSQLMRDVASPPPPYSAQGHPDHVMDAPLGTLEINSAPMNTRFTGSS